MIAVGAYLVLKGKEEVGGIIIGAAVTVYTGGRVMLKKGLLGLLLLVPLLMAGCCTGHIDAAGTEELATNIMDTHDSMVGLVQDLNGDGAVDEKDAVLKKALLLNTHIMRGIYAEALR